MLKGSFVFIGSNGLESGEFPLTVMTEAELTTKAQRELLARAKARNQAIDGIAIVHFSDSNIQPKGCVISKVTAAFGLK